MKSNYQKETEQKQVKVIKKDHTGFRYGDNQFRYRDNRGTERDGFYQIANLLDKGLLPIIFLAIFIWSMIYSFDRDGYRFVFPLGVSIVVSAIFIAFHKFIIAPYLRNHIITVHNDGVTFGHKGQHSLSFDDIERFSYDGKEGVFAHTKTGDSVRIASIETGYTSAEYGYLPDGKETMRRDQAIYEIIQKGYRDYGKSVASH